MDVQDILTRAQAGKSGKVNVTECLFLKRNIDAATPFPEYCERLLGTATKAGILARRNSRVAQAWDLTDGHGNRKVNATEVKGYFDSNPADEKSVHEMYLQSKSPEQREKINKLHVRTASRGARPRNDYEQFVADPETQKAVVEETRSELVRRSSRRGQTA